MAKIASVIIIISIILFPAIASASGWTLDLCLGDGCDEIYGGWNPEMLSAYGLPEGHVINIIENILYWLLAVLGIAGVIGFAISGILYLISTGDEDMIERAKNAMKWSIVGVVVGLAGLVVIQAVNLMLGAVSGF